MISRFFRFARIPTSGLISLPSNPISNSLIPRTLKHGGFSFRRYSIFPYPGEDQFQRIAKASQPSLRAICAVNRGIKNEESVRRDVTVVMIQLSKLTPGGERTIKTVLRKYAKKLGPECALGALWELIRRNDGRRAVEAFEAIYNLPWFNPDPMIFSHLINLMGREGEIAKAEALFMDMEKHKCPKTTLTYTAMIEAYGRKLNLSKVFQLFDEMKQLPGCFPDESTYSTIMRLLCKLGRLEEAVDLLDEMSMYGILPNSTNYNVIIDGLGRNGKIDEMETIYMRMQKSCIRPDLTTYNAFIRAYGKWGHIGKMEACFEKMQLDKCAPDYITFNCLIDAYAKWEVFDKMKNTLLHMVKMRYRLTVSAFNIAFRALGSARKITEMEKIMKTFNMSHLKPNPQTFSALVYGYGCAEREEKIMQLLRKSKSWGLSLDADCYNGVLIALCNCLAFDEIEKVIIEMRALNFKPDASAISSLVLAHAKAGRVADMEKIFKAARVERIKFTLPVYNAIMAAYGREKNFVAVEQVWENILRGGLVPDSGSFSEIVAAYANADNLEVMEKAFGQMKKSNCLASEDCLIAVLSAYARADKVTEMEKIFKVLQEGGFVLTCASVDVMIGCYSRNGMVQKAENLLMEFIKIDGIPRWNTYASMLTGYGFKRICDEIESQISSIESSRLPSDLKTVACLFWALSACRSKSESELLSAWICSFASEFYSPLVQIILHHPPGSESEEVLFQKLSPTLDNLRAKLENPEILRFVYSAIVVSLWNYGLQQRADRIIQDGISRGIFPLEISMHNSDPWIADFHFLPAIVAEISFYRWLQTCYNYALKFEDNSENTSSPTSVVILLHGITVRSRDKKTFLSPSEAGFALESILTRFSSPFKLDKSSLGDAMVASAGDFFDWVKHVFRSGDLAKSFSDATHFGPGWPSKNNNLVNPNILTDAKIL